MSYIENESADLAAGSPAHFHLIQRNFFYDNEKEFIFRCTNSLGNMFSRNRMQASRRTGNHPLTGRIGCDGRQRLLHYFPNFNICNRAVAEYLSSLFESAAGFKIKVTEDKNAAIRFIADSTVVKESYRMKVDDKGIIISASDRSGFFYAVQTLRMVLPPQIEASEASSSQEWYVQAMDINDGPRFGYRGLMIDVARYF